MDGTHHIMRCVHDAAYRPFVWDIALSIEKVLQSFLKSIKNIITVILFQLIFYAIKPLKFILNCSVAHKVSVLSTFRGIPPSNRKIITVISNQLNI